MVYWSWFIPACESLLYTILPSSLFSDFTVVAWYQPWWEYLHHGDQQTLEIRSLSPCLTLSSFFFFLSFPSLPFTSIFSFVGVSCVKIYQHITTTGPGARDRVSQGFHSGKLWTSPRVRPTGPSSNYLQTPSFFLQSSKLLEKKTQMAQHPLMLPAVVPWDRFTRGWIIPQGSSSSIVVSWVDASESIRYIPLRAVWLSIISSHTSEMRPATIIQKHCALL